jgi:hypothetical protein
MIKNEEWSRSFLAKTPTGVVKVLTSAILITSICSAPFNGSAAL